MPAFVLHQASEIVQHRERSCAFQLLLNCCTGGSGRDYIMSQPEPLTQREPEVHLPGPAVLAERMAAAGALLQVAWADESRLGKPDSDTGDLNTARILEHGNGPQSCSSFVTFRCRMSQLCG